MLLFGLVFLVAFVPIYRRRHRSKLGLCEKCGYSLEGLTEVRCPECRCATESLGKGECDMT